MPPGTIPVSYTLTLKVDLDLSTMSLIVGIDDQAGDHHLAFIQPEVTTFCYDWRDLALFLENTVRRCGRDLPKLNRPSPFLDLT